MESGKISYVTHHFWKRKRNISWRKSKTVYNLESIESWVKFRERTRFSFFLVVVVFVSFYFFPLVYFGLPFLSSGCHWSWSFKTSRTWIFFESTNQILGRTNLSFATGRREFSNGSIFYSLFSMMLFFSFPFPIHERKGSRNGCFMYDFLFVCFFELLSLFLFFFSGIAV